jgi:CO/xanthine dehydrogenase FAD-binding subunit
LEIGALAVLTDIIQNEQVQRHFPALAEAAGTVGSVQIRNRATLAGNICNASPAADTAPALLVYGARINLRGVNGSRRVPLSEFFVGPGQTVLQRGEIVASIELPRPQTPVGVAFTRLTRRRGVDLATINVCCLVEAAGVTRFAYGAVGPRPLLVADESGHLADPTVDEQIKEQLLKQLIGRASPISDVRASREYRLAMLFVLSRRALQTALNRRSALVQGS